MTTCVEFSGEAGDSGLAARAVLGFDVLDEGGFDPLEVGECFSAVCGGFFVLRVVGGTATVAVKLSWFFGGDSPTV